MSYLKRSYLIGLALSLIVLAAAPGSMAQTIYLDPAEVYITSGAGAEFDLVLHVDAQTVDLKLFTYYASFDTAELDTVSVAEGPLLPSSGATTIFNKYIVNGNNLQLEGLILGGGISVDGPGVLATVRVRVDDTGLTVIEPTEFRLRDVNGNFMTATAGGCTIYADVPPYEFNLLSPIGGEVTTGVPGEYVALQWEATASPYPGENVVYNLEYGTSATFDAGQTTTVTGLTSAGYQIAVADITPGTYYWRVTAEGTVNGFERLCTPASEHFTFAYAEVYPSAFALLDPTGGESVTRLPGEIITLSWEESTSLYPGEDVTYDLDYSSSPTFAAGQTVSLTGLTDNFFDLTISSLPPGTYYWRVTAEGSTNHLTTESTPTSTSFEFDYTYAPPGAFGLVSPADAEDVDVGGETEVIFDWDDAAPQFTGDAITYTFYFGPNPGLPTGAEITRTSSASQVAVLVADLPRNVTRYWTVEAANVLDQTTWADDEYSVSFSGCCVGRVGDANDSGEDEPTLGDISILVDLLFISNDPAIIHCWQEADVNQSGGAGPGMDDISLGDISVLIDYLFITGPGLGLANCP